jgi:putative acetyltransferase
MKPRDPPADACHVRQRAEADWPELLSVWVAAWRATFPDIDFEVRRDWLVSRISTLEANGAQTLCVFTPDGPVKPSAMAGFVTIDPRSGWLDQICVGPDYFGAGLAELLLSAAKEISPRKIRLDVNADNRRALAFYTRNGFAAIGEGASTLSGRATVLMEWPGAS